MVSTCSGRKPGSMLCSSRKLRSSSVPPMSRMSESATSATTRALRRRLRCEPGSEPRPASLRLLLRSLRVDCSAGARPKITPVSTEASSVKPSTVPSTPISLPRGIKEWLKLSSSSTPHTASSKPSPPPTRARNMLSVSNWRTSRQRPAPSAARTAISRCRSAMRERNRLATLAQAMSSTRETAAMSTVSAARDDPTISSCMGFSAMPMSVLLSGNACSRRAAMLSISACACRSDTSGFMRAMVNRKWLPRPILE